MTAAKRQRVWLERENCKWPESLQDVPRETWPLDSEANRIRVMRSRRFFVQVFKERGGVLRMSVNRTMMARGGVRWLDGITWDELQALKAEAGYATEFAVEIYPSAKDEVNVAMIRHLWILPEPLDIGWRAGMPR